VSGLEEIAGTAKGAIPQSRGGVDQ